MSLQNQRTELLLGTEAIEKLKKSTVAVIGVGGVGSFTVEALARASVGKLIIVDDDTIAESNINRQLHAMHSTIGKYKTEVMAERIHDINPDIEVEPLNMFISAENAASFFDTRKIDYVVDAVDTVTAKLLLIEEAKKRNIPIMSCMGAGNHLDPTKFQVADIYKTSVCPLAKVMRRECKKRGIRHLKVLFSTEEVTPQKGKHILTNGTAVPETKTVRTGKPKRQTPGSVSWVPSVAGLIIAGEVVKDLIK